MALLLSAEPLEAAVIVSDGAGGYVAHNQAYTAHVANTGFLASLIVKGVETMGAPLSFHAGTPLITDGVTLFGSTVTASFPGTGTSSGLRTVTTYRPRPGAPVFRAIARRLFAAPHTTIAYRFRSGGITITLLSREADYGTFTWTLSAATQAAELLNDKRALAGDAVAFVTSGEQRGLPAMRSERNQLMRCHYRGFAMETHFAIWNADFNFESAGVLQGMTWQRPLINPNRDYPFVLDIVPTPHVTTLPAVPFTPQAAHNASLYYTTESLSWTLDLGLQASYQYLRDVGITTLAIAWEVWDVHDVSVSTGTASITLGTGSAAQVVTVTTPGSGYYDVLFTLTDATGRMHPSSFRTRMTVIHPVAGMTNRLDSLTSPFSDYAVMAMIGTGAIREAYDFTGYTTTDPNDNVNWEIVPGATPSLWAWKTQYDTLVNHAVSESALYGLAWFVTLVGTNTLSASHLQAVAQWFVSRYRDRIPILELENEPNFLYSPQQYVDQVLVPYAAGAAAGGGIPLMGPDGVGVEETLEFLTSIYSNGKGSLLSAISTHTYPGPGESWEQYGNPKLLGDLLALMSANGDSAKPLWQTEQGYTWLLNNKAQAARYVVRQFLQGWRKGILPSRQFYFYPQYNGFESWYLASGGEAGSRDSWLPHAASLRFFAENTHGRTFQSALATGYRGIFLYRFSGGTDDVIVAWTFDFSDTLSFDAPGLLSVSDWMGNAVTPGTSGGHRTLPLSGEPCYLHLTSGTSFTQENPVWGTNYALATNGASALASSEETSAAFAIDGNSDTFHSRTRWRAEQTAVNSRQPAWLVVNFGQSRTISRFLAFCELPAVASTPASWQFQVDVAGEWSTVLFGTAERRWCVTGTFSPVTTTRVRFLVTQENDGWFFTDRAGKRIVGGPTFTQYTSGKLEITELEVYA